MYRQKYYEKIMCIGGMGYTAIFLQLKGTSKGLKLLYSVTFAKKGTNGKLVQDSNSDP